MRLLVGDVGGTNCRLALYDKTTLIKRSTVPSAAVSGLQDAIRVFVDSPVDAACFGVAGPVTGGLSRLTNLGWTLDAQLLSAQLNAPVRLINDFHAIALAVPDLTVSDFEPLRDHSPLSHTSMVVLGAGTGLGEAILTQGPEGWLVVPGEGAHCRFAPKTPREIELLVAFQRRYGNHVSVERVVSGPGISAVYDFLLGETSSKAPSAISAAALDGSSEIAAETLDIFVRTYADEAASLALKCNAGVVYLAGGITPRIMPLIRAGFRAAFEDKGRYREQMERVVVRVITHPDPGLLGALRGASQLC